MTKNENLVVINEVLRSWIMKKIKYMFLIICLFTCVFFFWKYMETDKDIRIEKREQIKLIEISEVETNEEKTDNVKINFEELANINSDIVAWIEIEGTNINYPVVQSRDNTYYLKHSFYKKWSNYGTIYMDATANKDFSSQNTFIYGHYTTNNSMFGELGNYMKQSFYESHPNIIIYTPNKNFRIEVFSVHVDDASSDSYQMNFTTEEAYKSYIDLMIEKSIIDSNVEVDYSTDRIVTLYSCSREANYKKQDRYYVHGRITNL